MSADAASGDGRLMLRIATAAPLIDTPISTVRRWAAAGEIPNARKVGRCWLVPRSWVYAEPSVPVSDVAA